MNTKLFIKKCALISATLFMFTGTAIAVHRPVSVNWKGGGVDTIGVFQVSSGSFVLVRGGSGGCGGNVSADDTGFGPGPAAGIEYGLGGGNSNEGKDLAGGTGFVSEDETTSGD